MNEPDQIYDKFHVARKDPAAHVRHVGCQYFVLDLTHDPAALYAIEAYADACQGDRPGLASDLRQVAMRSQLRRKSP